MFLRYLLVLFCMIAYFSGNAAVLPAEGARLHYRIVRFIANDGKGGKTQLLEIAEGNQADNSSFEAHIVATKTYTNNEMIAEVPHWNSQYTWRVGGRKGSLHHFTTGGSMYTNIDAFRLRIIFPAIQFTNGYIFLDAAGIICDMKGKAVWYFPLADGNGSIGSDLRDFKASVNHTITCLYKNNPIELTWEGRVLWKGSDHLPDDKNELLPFHHEFTVLKNGHYMVLGNDFFPGEAGNRIQFGTVLEYTKSGKVVWQWKSADVYQQTQYAYGQAKGEPYDVHQNAFYFDEKSKHVYVGFKNISQIVKIKYPEGKVTNIYGRQFGKESKGEASFFEQHSIMVSSSNQLLVFDNHNENGTVAGFLPRVVAYQEKPNGSLEQDWAFSYQGLDKSLVRNDKVITSGGCFKELPGENYLISLCAPFANICIVNKEMRINWNAVAELYDTLEKRWKPDPQYRTHVVADANELHKLIKYK